jgi:predicted phosphodiesterase
MSRALGVVIAAVLLSGCVGSDPEPSAPAGSTLRATLADPDGDGFLSAAAGEPLRDRTDLAPAARREEVLVTLAQLTDTHVRDEESPARVPFLARYGGVFSSTFRPQEALSTQVLAAAVRAVNAERPDAVLVTGDVVDDAQRNELDMARSVLDGGRVDPDSGGPGYRGVQEADSPDPLYYRPDVDAPTHAGLLAAAQRAFRSPGLRAPWYAVPGNHDVSVAGEVAPTARLDAIATRRRLVTSLDPAVDVAQLDRTNPVAAIEGAAAREMTVPADPRRRHLRPEEVAGGIGGDRAVRLAHGVRIVLLDTADPSGGSRPRVLPAQLEWLERELSDRDGRWVVVASHHRLTGAAAAVLRAHRNVVAAIHGDTHRNEIVPRGSYWEIGTSSLADFPQQARLIRLRRAGRGVAIETWMVDHDGRGLAGVARELAYIDAQGGRPKRFAGGRLDRNARLYAGTATDG